MAKKLYFNDFKKSIENRSFPIDKLSEYVELDPNSAVPKLKVISDSILDSVPDDYDIDIEIYKLSREIQEQEYEQIKYFGFSGKKRVVAEGDSWFNLPPILRPKAIADRMKSNGNFKVINIAYWGHTIERIYSEKEYLVEIDKVKADYFMLSGGGNDLQNGLENETDSIICQYDPGLPLAEYLTEKGHDLFNNIEDKYRGILTEVTTNFPNLKTFCHGYDYPRPTVGGGKYIGKYLKGKGIPEHVMSKVMVGIMNDFNVMVKRVVKDFGNSVIYVNCLNVTEPYTWRDDMHPGGDGFKALANTFEKSIENQV